MEKREKNKRAREDDGVDEIESSFENYNNNAKKRNVYGISFTKEKNNEVEEKDCFKSWDYNYSHLAMGVFDFPWLKDGVISKSYEYCLDFEDNFLSSLECQLDTFFKDGVDFSEECRFCETPEASILAHNIQEAKLVEDMWQPFESNVLEPLEAEDVDCIWSFLINKPL